MFYFQNYKSSPLSSSTVFFFFLFLLFSLSSSSPFRFGNQNCEKLSPKSNKNFFGISSIRVHQTPKKKTTTKRLREREDGNNKGSSWIFINFKIEAFSSGNPFTSVSSSSVFVLLFHSHLYAYFPIKVEKFHQPGTGFYLQVDSFYFLVSIWL